MAVDIKALAAEIDRDYEGTPKQKAAAYIKQSSIPPSTRRMYQAMIALQIKQFRAAETKCLLCGKPSDGGMYCSSLCAVNDAG